MGGERIITYTGLTTGNTIGTSTYANFTERGTQSPFHPMGYYTFIYKKTDLN